MTSALVVGGTGPTGPTIVEGLLERGHTVTVFHSGRHEAELSQDVEHVHGDPHFPETIASALGNRTFEVVVAQYGRLRHLGEHLRGRAGHVVAIGGATVSLALPDSPVWGPLGRPVRVPEGDRVLESDEEANRFGYRVASSMKTLFTLHHEGAFAATYIGYPILYGPRQPGAREWSVVRRLLDGRRQLILPDGGVKVESRGYVLNVAQAPLLALDRPEVSAGKSYVVADAWTHSERQRADFMAAHLGREVEMVDIPYELAGTAHPWYQHRRTSGLVPSDRIRDELGYRDTWSPEEALTDTVDWLRSRGPDEVAEIERQLGDPFDYAGEDRLVAAWRRCADELRVLDVEVPSYAHIYRHPSHIDEDWVRPDGASPPA